MRWSRCGTDLRTLFTATLLFSVLFCAVGLLLAHEFSIGAISTRSLAIALAALLLVSAVGVALILRSGWMCGPILEPRHKGSESRRGTLLAMWTAKIAVIVLVLAFLNGLRHITERPLAPRLVGLGANLLVTFAVVSVIQKITRGPK